MTKHLATTTTLTLLVLALSVTPPAAASSGSLLSGYGGPGQGSQAILGSALLNGPSGGSPGSGSGGVTTSTATSGAASGASPASARHASHVARSSSATANRGGKSSTDGARAYSASDEAAAAKTRVQDSSTLGLSGADVLYLLLALGALALTAVVTRGLARSTHDGKAHG